MNKMNKLKELTIIIPVYIDSNDRLNNAITVLGYINNHFETNLIIHELVDSESKLDFLHTFKNLNIKHITESRNDNNYHRTKQLNEMLNIVKTSVVCNYDIDIILPIDSYIKSVTEIENGNFDVIYPFGNGGYQKRVYQSFDRHIFNIKYDISLINNNYDIWNAAVGHCVFLKTQLYKICGGENENFVAYGPEDVERFERFQKFNFRIGRVNEYVYHFEHYRKEFSSHLNPDFNNNEKLLNEIRLLNNHEFVKYYENVEYRKRYNF